MPINGRYYSTAAAGHDTPETAIETVAMRLTTQGFEAAIAECQEQEQGKSARLVPGPTGLYPSVQDIC